MAQSAVQLAGFSHDFSEHVEEWLLAFEDAPARLLNRKPASPIDFGKVDLATGARRPLHLAVIADHLCRIAIAFKGPGRDDLSARLPDRTEFEKVPVHRKARFFLEFAPGCFDRELPIGIFSLWDRPCARIFLGPEWTAGMHKEHFDIASFAPIHQQARTSLCHKQPPDPV